MGTGDVLARIEAEKENPQADIDWGAINFNFYKQHPDLWESYVSPQRGQPGRELPQQHRRQRDLLQPVRQRLLHPEQYLLKKLALSQGYADLLQPELKGKIAMGDPTASSSAFAELTNMLLDMARATPRPTAT